MRDVGYKARELSKYRFENANEDLHSAKRALSEEEYRTANNRAYYAIFHALRAVLALDEFDAKHHSAVISRFRQDYIKTGIVDKSISDIIGDAFEIRNKSDYEDMFIVDKEETKMQVANAERLLNVIGAYLKSEGILDL